MGREASGEATCGEKWRRSLGDGNKEMACANHVEAAQSWRKKEMTCPNRNGVSSRTTRRYPSVGASKTALGETKLVPRKLLFAKKSKTFLSTPYFAVAFTLAKHRDKLGRFIYNVDLKAVLPFCPLSSIGCHELGAKQLVESAL